MAFSQEEQNLVIFKLSKIRKIRVNLLPNNGARLVDVLLL